MTLNVLAIDDSRTMRALVSRALQSGGFSVTTADDGVDGVAAFGQGRFDAVITDINMPNMDGFGVIETLRRNPANRRVPILVLSTETGKDLRDRARAAGATGWIAKPFDDQALVDVVRKVTGAR